MTAPRLALDASFKPDVFEVREILESLLRDCRRGEDVLAESAMQGLATGNMWVSYQLASHQLVHVKNQVLFALQRLPKPPAPGEPDGKR